MFLSIAIVSSGALASSPYVRAMSVLAQTVTSTPPSEIMTTNALRGASLVLVEVHAGARPNLAGIRRACPDAPLIGVIVAPSAGAQGAEAVRRDANGFTHLFEVTTPAALVGAIRGHAAKPVQGATVLVIDDDEALRSLAEELLEDAGYKVMVAADGPAGLAALRSARIDILLVDMRMPGMSGADVCRQVRADPSTAELPVLIVSGVDALGEKLSAFDAGANDFLSKPYGEEELIAKVVRLLSMAESRRMADRIRRPPRK